MLQDGKKRVSCLSIIWRKKTLLLTFLVAVDSVKMFGICITKKVINRYFRICQLTKYIYLLYCWKITNLILLIFVKFCNLLEGKQIEKSRRNIYIRECSFIKDNSLTFQFFQYFFSNTCWKLLMLYNVNSVHSAGSSLCLTAELLLVNL